MGWQALSTEAELQTAKPDLPLGRYKHFRGGEYEVLGFSRDSETHEWRVLYKPLYETRHPDIPWDRPFTRFVGSVMWNGEMVSRYSLVKPSAGLAVTPRYINPSDMDTYAQSRNLYPSVATRAYQGIGRLYLDQRQPDSLLAHLPRIKIDRIAQGSEALSQIANAAFRDVQYDSLENFVESYEDERSLEPTKAARNRYDERLPQLVGRGTLIFYQDYFNSQVDSE